MDVKENSAQLIMVLPADFVPMANHPEDISDWMLDQIAYCHEHSKTLVLDLRRILVGNSAIIGWMVAVRTVAEQNSVPLRIRNPSRPMRRLLQIMHLDFAEDRESTGDGHAGEV